MRPIFEGLLILLLLILSVELYYEPRHITKEFLRVDTIIENGDTTIYIDGRLQ